MADSGFLAIMAIGGWLFSLVAFLGLLGMKRFLHESQKLCADILAHNKEVIALNNELLEAEVSRGTK